jgi:hypothetical protein
MGEIVFIYKNRDNECRKTYTTRRIFKNYQRHDWDRQENFIGTLKDKSLQIASVPIVQGAIAF